MTTKLERQRFVDPARLSGEHYVVSLLGEGAATGLLTPDEAEHFQLAVLNLLARRCQLYQGGSSSILEEAAQELLESVLFTMGVWCKTLPDPDAAALALVTQGPDAAFEAGRKAVRALTARTKQLWLLVLGSRVETGNYSYEDTLCEQGIGEFFHQYDKEFAAHEIPCDIDYQLCRPVGELAGVEFIREYLSHVLCENRICARFAPGAVERLLCAYDKRSDSLLLNLFGVAYTAAVGCMLAGKDPHTLALCPADLVVICAALGRGAAEVFARAAQELVARLELSPAEAEYALSALPVLLPDVERALKLGAPQRVFPVTEA